jgi:hypothetical protein
MLAIRNGVHELTKVFKLTLGVVFLLSIGACKVVELRNPEPIVTALAPEKTRSAIVEALGARGWLLAKEEPGEMYATLHLRTHTAQVLVSYDTEEVSIKYLDSENLKYRQNKKGKEYIHKNYNSWVKTLLKDISKRTGKPSRE